MGRAWVPETTEIHNKEDTCLCVACVQANAVSDKVLDLRMCDFTGKDLSGKTLSGALLKDAILPNSTMRETVLTKVWPFVFPLPHTEQLLKSSNLTKEAIPLRFAGICCRS